MTLEPDNVGSTGLPVYRKDQFPGRRLEGLGFTQFIKTSPTWAMRITGAFQVETSEGTLTCQDGWLAIDARGYPYPIAADEFAQIYMPQGELLAGQPGGVQGLTIKQLIDGAITEIQDQQRGLDRGDPAGREFALAITALEDAKLRATRGLAHRHGIFNEVDLQNPAGIARAKDNFDRNVMGNQPGGIARSAEPAMTSGGGPAESTR